MLAASPLSQGCPWSTSRSAIIPEGTFAPAIVSQKTTPSMRIINGNPVMGLVSQRSRLRSRSKRARFIPLSCERSAMRSAAA